MKPMATCVSKTVTYALGSCLPKPSNALLACTTSTPLACARRSATAHSRPFYTRAREWSSSRMTSEIVSKFPTKIDHRMAPSSLSSLTSLHSHILPQSFMPNVRELVFLGGAPGSGKGTNSAYISQLKGFDAPAIVVSDLLNTPTCKQLKENGAMVNDEFVFKALCKELEKPIYRNGVVVDGFPRTSKQAEFLTDFYNQAKSSMLSPPQISFVMLHIDETASIERQQARGREALAMNEGRISLSLSPPVEVRTTDLNVEASKARYVVFREQLNAVMELTHQFPLVVVDASPPLEVVQANLANQIATLPTM